MTLLPDFLIIGAPKAATTSLYRYMDQHPDIFFAATKEPHYFLHYGRRIHWTGPEDDHSARNHVATRAEYEALFKDARPEQRRGEASVHYLDQPEVIPRIRKDLGPIDVIVCLRDPVRRAYSNYLHMVRFGREELSFEDALDAEQERLDSGYRPFWGYFRQGLYHQHLRPWAKAFGKKRIHIVLFDELAADPDAVVRRLFRALGVDEDAPIDTGARHNITGLPKRAWLHRLLGKKRPLWGLPRILPKKVRLRLRSRLQRSNAEYPDMSPATMARLRRAYAEDSERLATAFHLDLSGWSDGADY